MFTFVISGKMEGMHNFETVRTAHSETQHMAKSVDYDAAMQRVESIREKELSESPQLVANSKFLPSVVSFAQDNDFFGYHDSKETVLSMLQRKSDALNPLGLALSDLNEQEKESIHEELSSQLKTDVKEVLRQRLIKLQKSDLQLSEVLENLKDEFADNLDQETIAILNRFNELVSPSIISDPKEREAVEVLFATQNIGSFTEASFTNFVTALYEGETVSEETKTRIEKKFGIPRSPIKTGAELSEWTLKQDEDGNYLHSSPETALEFRPGLKTHVDTNGKAVLTLAGSARSAPIAIPPEALRNGESIAQLANYTLVRQVVFREFNQLTNLFGGGTEAALSAPNETSISNANRFARTLIGDRQRGTIFSHDDLGELECALRSLHDPSLTDEQDSLDSLSDLGILESDFNWSRLDQIGNILREHGNYQTFELREKGKAHELLKKEIERRSDYGKQRTTDHGTRMHGTGKTVHELGRLRLGKLQESLFFTKNWWIQLTMIMGSHSEAMSTILRIEPSLETKVIKPL